VHNHPSGNLEPSTADINLTSRVKEACDIVDINLLDHLIISKDGYYSFIDENNL
jgi:DNA repair protein RadC